MIYLLAIQLMVRLYVLISRVLRPLFLYWTLAILSLQRAVGCVSRVLTGGTRVCLWGVWGVSVISWCARTGVRGISVIGRISGQRLRIVLVIGSIMNSNLRQFFLIGGIPVGGVRGIPLIGGRVVWRWSIDVWDPVGGVRVLRQVSWCMVWSVRWRVADGRCLMVERQCAVAVLSWEYRGGATISWLIGRLTLNRNIWMALSWVIGLEEGAVNKALCDYGISIKNRSYSKKLKHELHNEHKTNNSKNCILNINTYHHYL